jgi:hypothetical protein
MLLAVDDDGEPPPCPLVRTDPPVRPLSAECDSSSLPADEGATASDADWSGDVLIFVTGMDAWASAGDGTLPPSIYPSRRCRAQGAMEGDAKSSAGDSCVSRRSLPLREEMRHGNWQGREARRLGTPGGRIIAVGHPGGPPPPSSGTAQIFSV